MKHLIILARIVLVGLLWSIFFVEGIRVIMLTNWRFDIFQMRHWKYAWDLWYSGIWVIDDTKEWAFVLIIVSFIPLWLTGWAALSLINWEKLLIKTALYPIKIFNTLFRKQVMKIKSSASIKAVQKKKSYKEVRPRGARGAIEDRSSSPIIAPSKPIKATRKSTASKETKPAETKEFEHSLFKFGEEEGEESFDFNFDAFDVTPEEKPAAVETKEREKPARDKPKDNNKNKERDNRNERNDNKNKKPNQNQNRAEKPTRNESSSFKPSGNSTLDVISQKGYQVVTGATIKNNLIDFIGVSSSQICICLVDKEVGDWLADEERFNDEEPLWFSESSHRISPVRKVSLAKAAIRDKLSELEDNFEIKAYVIISIGNIINAEDMFEIWDEMDISVTRIDRGSPKELKLFSKTLDDAVDSIDKDKFEKIKKIVRNIS